MLKLKLSMASANFPDFDITPTIRIADYDSKEDIEKYIEIVKSLHYKFNTNIDEEILEDFVNELKKLTGNKEEDEKMLDEKRRQEIEKGNELLEDIFNDIIDETINVIKEDGEYINIKEKLKDEIENAKNDVRQKMSGKLFNIPPIEYETEVAVVVDKDFEILEKTPKKRKKIIEKANKIVKQIEEEIEKNFNDVIIINEFDDVLPVKISFVENELPIMNLL